ncbi:MAG: cytidylate kinase-like family protein [Acidobacteria bacterium]|nr:cytidylate kinase-like family protein [Acidobacteriota bacterium]MBW4045412.1 cytidylate kinase-like family protein [Acidobacteriota bacterium]
MVRVITVEREYGSQGAEFAHHLAGRLGWRLIDQCFIDEIASKAGIPQSLAKNCDERLDPWYYRFGKAFWHGSIERMPAVPEQEVFDSERMVGFVREYLNERASEGNCVIVGRGASSVLFETPHVFRVFVYASMVRKVRWFEEHFPEHAGSAEEEIIATDKRRAAYVRRYYQHDWTDRRLYHLMMNSCMGFDCMVQAAIDAAGLGASVSALEQRSV